MKWRWPVGPVVALIVLLLSTPTASAHDTTDGNDDPRIEALQAEVRELRALVERLLAAQGSTGLAAAPPDAELAEGLQHGSAEGFDQEEDSGLAIPSLTVRGFGHVQYDFEATNPNEGSVDTTNHFTNGDLDLFVTSQIAPRLSFLSETLFEFKDSGETDVDVERLLLRYEFVDWFNLAMGRGHTALGYWNQRYHHGAWLQTTTDRPLLYRFEDEGGFLPMHFVGLEATGSVGFDPGAVSYVANVGNGRGEDPQSIQFVNDLNDEKMVSLMLTFEPAAAPGLGIGANVLWDRIPPNRDVGRRGSMNEVIAGAHVYYVTDPYELIAEGQLLDHDDGETGRNFSHHGGYVQAAYRLSLLGLDEWKPYYRFDWLGVESGDPFFIDPDSSDGRFLEGFEDTTGHTVGLRYDWKPFAAIKTEYRRQNAESANSDATTVQFSFAF